MTRARWLALLVAGAAAAAAAALAHPGGGLRPVVAVSMPGDLGRLPAGWQSTCRLAPAPPPVPAQRVLVRRGVRWSAGLLDLYLPAGGARPPAPVVVAVHGGGWTAGSRTGMAWTATALARAGFVVAAPDYPLVRPAAPARSGSTYPSAVQQVGAVVRDVRSHARAIGGDPGRVGILGSSAGGQLGALVADEGGGPCTTGTRVAALVTWSAPLDLPALGRCRAADGGCRLTALIRAFLGCAEVVCPGRWRAASPVDAVSADDPPTLLFTSTDEFVPAGQAQAMQRALRRAAVPVWLVRLPGRRHASDYRSTAIEPTIEFLGRVLSGSPAVDGAGR